MDPALKPDPELNEIEDIERAFVKMDADRLPTASQP
jgi:hypothetical protein